jgi:arsenate reductase-like glutaredoxin family protein
VNTDQAFDFLKNAGVSEERSIETVRRWMRERKISYAGKLGPKENDYIIENTDLAIELLKDAGVSANVGIPLVKRLYLEGKIQKVGNGYQISKYIPNQPRIENKPPMFHDIKEKIKAQDKQLQGLEELHKTSVRALIEQRNNLKKELAILSKEKMDSQKESEKVLKENIELRKELLKLKEELSKQGKKVEEPIEHLSVSNTADYRQKLGLSKKAGKKEVLSGFKKLLKLTHPDHGGSAEAFHYIKMDYDQYKDKLK